MENKDKKIRVDVSLGLKHNLLRKIWLIIVALAQFIWKKMKLIGRFTKKIRKIFIAVSVIGVLVGCVFGGYYVYTEYKKKREYQKLAARLEHKLNNFNKPDSVFIASDYVLSHSSVKFLDSDGEIPTYNYKSLAIENMKKLAETGNKDAQFTLGLYYSGFDFEQEQWDEDTLSNNIIDQEKAAYWYLQAANQGHSGAMNNLGLKYKNGQGVDVDFVKALYWFRKSAQDENETGYGALNLGDCFKDGLKSNTGSHEKRIKEYYMGYWVGEHYETVQDYKDVLTANIDSAMYYWKIAEKRGCPEAKDRLQKVYE